MNRKTEILKLILRRTLKTLAYGLISAILLFLILIGLINIPSVQTKIVHELSDYLSEELHFPVKIERVNIGWFDHVLLYNVSITDPQKYKMIEVSELKVDFQLSTIFSKNIINLDDVELSHLSVRLIRDAKTRDLNIDNFIIALSDLFASSDTISTGHPAKFTIDDAILNDCYFKYSDLAKDSISDGFDYNHFSFDSIYSEVSDVNIIRDTIEINIETLATKEDNLNFPVHNLTTFFRLTKHSIQLQKLNASLGKSEVKDSLVFEYKSISDLNDFNKKVKIRAHLDESKVYTKDLALFAPELVEYDDTWNISGRTSGTVSKLSVKGFELKFGGLESVLKGDIKLDGLPDFFETFIELNLKPSVLYTQDLAQYINEEKTNEILHRIGTISFKGKFLGFPDDFVSNGEFFTPVGYVRSDVNLKLKTDSLKGNIITKNLNLGKITGNLREIQELDMKGNLEGKGFKLKEASYKLNASISRLGLYEYDYKNITTNATLKNQFFEGMLQIKDSNLVMNVAGKIDLREDKKLLNLKAKIDTAFLQPLNITRDFTILSTNVNINTKGIKPDEIVGEAYFTNTFVRLKGNEATIDSLYFDSKKDSKHRTFYLWSNPVEINADGNFEFTRIYEDVSRLAKEYYLNFVNNEKSIKNYYREKNGKNLFNYGLNYQFHFKDINPILHLFTSDFSLSKNVILKGRFSNGYTSILNFNTFIDSLNYKDYSFHDIEVDVSSSKKADSVNVLASTYVYSKAQRFGNFLNTKDFSFEGIWNDKRIEFNSFIQERNRENLASLNGEFNFLNDSTELKFASSLIKVLDNEWKINDNNNIVFTKDNILFRDFSIVNNDQSISILGNLSDTTVITAHDFDLLVLKPLIKNNISGSLNGFINVKDFYHDPIVDSHLTIDSLIYDDLYVGDFSIQSDWDRVKKVVASTIGLIRDKAQILSAEGTYNPYDAENALDFKANFNQTSLVLFEPFIRDIFSKLGGTVSGEVKITGRISNPVLNGEAFVKNGTFKVNYLNTQYSFNDWIHFTEDGFKVKNLRLKDDNNNIAVLNGGIFYDSYKNFILDLSGSLGNFKVLNTTVNDNDLFYGTAIVSGDFEILGAFNNIDIKANARSNKGTKIFIPLGGYSKVEQEEYIRFASKSDTIIRKQEIAKKITVSGIRLDFNLDITPDAMCELIFDPKAGDIIRGYGDGKIRMRIDTRGEFTMMGSYEIQKGGYNFTLANLINKEFDILPNSSITWYGDPYKAILDIRAAYKQRASYLPIIRTPLEVETKSDPVIRRLYPVIVYLYLKGDLMSPDIKYKIEFKDYPAQITSNRGPNKQTIPLASDVIAYSNLLATNEQELNKQVFSLLILKRLSTPDGFYSGGGLNAGASVSELLSNQLSYWASQYNENLEVNVDLNGFDADALNTFQLRFSYSALGGRLRVTREGGFTNSQNQANFASIAGEWTIEYDLTNDGIFRLKLYNRNNYNGLNSFGSGNTQQTSTTGGVSIMHTQSFDALKELNIFKKKKEESAPVEPGDDDPTVPQTLNQTPKKEEETVVQGTGLYDNDSPE